MKKQKLLMLLAVTMVLVLAVGPVSAATLTLDETVEVSFDKSSFNVSVYPGKASYSGFNGTVTGDFGDGTVLGYRNFDYERCRPNRYSG